jgi:hypothetical protein
MTSWVPGDDVIADSPPPPPPLPDGRPRLWLYGLTADEWLHLACEGHDSEIANCCGNIEQIQDTLRAIMTMQPLEYRSMRVSLGKMLREYLGEDGSGGHGLDDPAGFPLLHRLLAGLAAEKAAEHEENESWRRRHEETRARRDREERNPA